MVLNMVILDDKTTCTLSDVVLRSVFYGECFDEDVIFACSLLQLEFTLLLVVFVRVTETNFG